MIDKEHILRKPLSRTSRDILVLILFVVTAYVFVFDSKLSNDGDNLNYWLMAKSLANSDGYVNAWELNSPPQKRVPPAYSLFISMFMRIGVESFVFVKILNGILLLSSTVICYFIFLRLVDRNSALLVSIAIGICPILMRYATVMWSDSLFMLSSYGTVLVFFVNEDTNKFESMLSVLLLAFLAALSMYTRTIGISLAAALFVYFLLRKRWKVALLFSSVTFLFMLPWLMRIKSLKGFHYVSVVLKVNPYDPELGASDVTSLMIRFAENLLVYVSDGLPKIFYLHPTWIKYSWTTFNLMSGMLIITLIIFGAYTNRKHIGFVSLYTVLTCGILLLYPRPYYTEGYLIPLIPLIIFYFYQGVIRLLTLIAAEVPLISGREVYSVSFLLIFQMYSLIDLHTLARWHNSEKWTNYFESAIWAKDNTKSDALFSCRKGQFFYYYSGRKTTGYKYTYDSDKLISGLIESGVDYVVIDELGFSSTGKFLLPALNDFSEKFDTVYVSGSIAPAVILKFKR